MAGGRPENNSNNNTTRARTARRVYMHRKQSLSLTRTQSEIDFIRRGNAQRMMGEMSRDH
jgi:hypothetical protein